MANVALALALIVKAGLSLASQSFAAQVTASRDVADVLTFERPSLHDHELVPTP